MRALSLTIREGDRWAILGDNGAGKTVTAQLLGRSLGRVAPLVSASSSAIASSARVSKHGRDVVHVSFESHRRLLQDEAKEYRESRFDVTSMRATVASFLFPELYPVDPAPRVHGYRPKRTRLAPLPVPYDAEADFPLLAELEQSTTTGLAGTLLRRFGLSAQRHRPLHALSTGEARKLMVVDCLLSPPALLVLDEAFDGLDADSRAGLRDVLLSTHEQEIRGRALLLIAHYKEDLVPAPTHALLLGQGSSGVGYQKGGWGAMEPAVEEFFEAQHLAASKMAPMAVSAAAAATASVMPRNEVRVSPTASAPAPTTGEASTAAEGADTDDRRAVLDFRGVTIRYNSTTVFDSLRWTVRRGEKWVVQGGNGTGKSTLIELITGDNVLGFGQDLWLFGRKKGSGESIWDIRSQLGLVSTEMHMEYIDYADPAVRSFNSTHAGVTTWDVVCSGFFDSIGLRGHTTSRQQEAIARDCVQRLGLQDLVTPPAATRGRPDAAVAAARPLQQQNFFHLSHGQQKLVLLGRAMVKRPQLLLLDEPTHGLSGFNRERLIRTLGLLHEDPEVAIVYVTHRNDEADSLGFHNLLRLG